VRALLKRAAGALLTLLALGALPTLAETEALRAGDPAPPFTLPGTDGNTHRLSDYEGRWVVLAFFPKAYTGGCTIECKALRDASRELGAFDVAYFMASTDNLEDNRGFAAQNNANFPLLSDASKTVAEAYGVLRDNGLARRWTFYIDPEGVIQRVDRAVDPREAGAMLVKNLRSLGAPES
jgi:peroxiredoxin Q/BCP